MFALKISSCFAETGLLLSIKGVGVERGVESRERAWIFCHSYPCMQKRASDLSEANFHAGEIRRPREAPTPRGTSLLQRKIYTTKNPGRINRPSGAITDLWLNLIFFSSLPSLPPSSSLISYGLHSSCMPYLHPLFYN